MKWNISKYFVSTVPQYVHVILPAHNEMIKVVLVRLMVAWRSCGPTIYTGLSLLNNHLDPAIITESSPALQYFRLLLPFHYKILLCHPCEWSLLVLTELMFQREVNIGLWTKFSWPRIFWSFLHFLVLSSLTDPTLKMTLWGKFI